MEAIMTGGMTLFFYALVIAAVWKLFQVASDLGEIKTLLSDIRRNTTTSTLAPAQAAPPPALPGPISLESAEALLREVAAESEAHR
jgi:hypothetical protein